MKAEKQDKYMKTIKRSLQKRDLALDGRFKTRRINKHESGYVKHKSQLYDI